ncbi:MAG: hypothetical protein RL160_347 [Bacteroidota bacterium]
MLYLSHGSLHTGGYAHEKEFCAAIQKHGFNTFREVRFTQNFKGPFAWLQLGLKTFRAAKQEELVVTVARLAWPVWWAIKRNPKQKMLLVLHNYDPKDGKPHVYYWLLNRFLGLVARKHQERVRVVCVAAHWQHLFREKFGIEAFHFPNFFPDEPYQSIRASAEKDPKLIHLGQWSAKADLNQYEQLLSELQRLGYTCFFSSPEAVDDDTFPVHHFALKTDYLKMVASSAASIILNKVQEGWSRVAHESFLLGTPVVCLKGGGLEELVAIGGGRLVRHWNEVPNLLQHPEQMQTNPEALNIFHSSCTERYMQPMLKWLF